MKKLLMLLLALLLTVCTFSAIAEQDLTFGYIAYMMSDNWNEYSAMSFEYAAEKFGVNVMVLDSGNDIAQSISAMETLIQAEVDGISVFPISPEQGAQLITMATKQASRSPSRTLM